jgi:hypothetical protein
VWWLHLGHLYIYHSLLSASKLPNFRDRVFIFLSKSEVPSLGSIQTCLYAIPRAEIVYIYCVSLIVFDSGKSLFDFDKQIFAHQTISRHDLDSHKGCTST